MGIINQSNEYPTVTNIRIKRMPIRHKRPLLICHRERQGICGK